MFKKILININMLIGFKYWFSVKYTYKNKKNVEVFHYFAEIGLSAKSDILDHRDMKKVETVLHKKENVKHLLSNGKFYFQPNAYLGYFKR